MDTIANIAEQEWISDTMNKNKWISYDKAITALYQLEEYRSAEWGAKRFTTDDIESMLEELAEGSIVPKVQGKWIYSNGKWNCSECGREFYGEQVNSPDDGERDIFFHFCPNCGARMDGDGE